MLNIKFGAGAISKPELHSVVALALALGCELRNTGVTER
jgi:hypothetical protein